MPHFDIKVTRRPNLEVRPFSQEQMQEIGEFSIETMKARVSTGTDVLDQPAKPLRPNYARRKERQGKQPIRDIRLTGNTLGSVQVIEADATHVKVGIRGATPYRKALFNQNIDPWFGLSGHDDARVLEEKVRPIFSQNIADAMKSS